MSPLKIGTASWTDRSLIDSGAYYPKDCTSAEARLRFYSAEFPLVEVDSTYYGLPSERNSELWVDRTPKDFTFNIKAFRLFTTHQTPHRALPAEVREQLPLSYRARRTSTTKTYPARSRSRCGRCSGAPSVLSRMLVSWGSSFSSSLRGSCPGGRAFGTLRSAGITSVSFA